MTNKSYYLKGQDYIAKEARIFDDPLIPFEQYIFKLKLLWLPLGTFGGNWILF